MSTGVTQRDVSDLKSMSVKELCDHHRDLLLQMRYADHWRRVIAARLDLCVAAVADLEELSVDDLQLDHTCSPPGGLRMLAGITAPGRTSADRRLMETALL